MRQKAFSIIFKGLLLKQIKTKFLEGESPTSSLIFFLIFGTLFSKYKFFEVVTFFLV